jgi:Flagellar motor component
MDFSSIIGIIASFGLVLYGYTMDGGDIMGLLMISAIIITVGGTFGALFLSYGFDNLKHFPSLFMEVFIKPKSKLNEKIELLITLSRTAKQSGLLSLEKTISNLDEKKGGIDPFIKKGTLMVVDGTENERIQEILGNDIYIYEQKKLTDISMFDTCAQFGPAFGMIGTIVGLIQMLAAGMDDPNELTKAIGVAFITTLYGSLLANCIFSPSVVKLKTRLAAYRLEKEMIIDAVCAIRNGVNPKMLQEQLEAYGVPKNKKGKKAEVLKMMGSDKNTKTS